MKEWTEEKWRQHIKEFIELKKAKSPGYSARAFARDADIDPTLIYRILNGSRGISLSVRIKLEEYFS